MAKTGGTANKNQKKPKKTKKTKKNQKVVPQRLLWYPQRVFKCFYAESATGAGRGARLQLLGRELRGIELDSVGYAELVHLGLFPGGR